MKTYAALFFSLMFLLACEKDTSTPNVDVNYELNQEFTLHFDRTASAIDDAPQIKFTRLVREERCPDNEEIACIWEGQVIVELNVDGQLVELGLTAFYEVPNTFEINGYVVQLLDVLPYPTQLFTQDNPADESVYKVTIVVAKN